MNLFSNLRLDQYQKSFSTILIVSEIKTILIYYESVKKTNRLVTVEESWPFGSIGSEISNIVQREVFDYLDSPVIKVNSADVPMPYSSFLENLYLPQTEDIVNALKKVCYIQ